MSLFDACHLRTIYTTIIDQCTFSPIGIFVGLAQQSKWNVSKSYQLIQTCTKKITNQKPKNNYYMISKTNGLIDYMNKQHKGYSTMERTFHLWITTWEFNFLFSFRTLTIWSVSACFVLKSTKYLMVVLSTACDCAVWRKYPLEAIIKLLFISSYHDKCLLFMLELY